MYVVTGASGNTGSVVANRLLSSGKQVRVIGRKAERLREFAEHGAEIFSCDITDTSALNKAFAGAEGVYVMIPPDIRSSDYRAFQNRASDSVAAAVRQAGVQHVVTLSSVGADKESGTGPVVGLHSLEQKLNAIPNLNVLHLRAGYFMENTLAQAGIIKAIGATAGPLAAELQLPMIATRDIANAAADALLKLDFSGSSSRELLGPRDLCMNDVNAALAMATGKHDLHYIQLPAVQVRNAMLQMGMSESSVKLLLEMSDALNSGHMKALETRSPQNTTPTSYQTFVADEFLPLYQGSRQAA